MHPSEYSRLSEAEEVLWWYRALHAFVVGQLKRHAGPPGRPLTLLDVGCGTGGLLARLAETFPTWKLIGLDSSPHAVSLARAKAPVSVVLGSVNELPFEDRSLDVVLGMDVLYHREVDEARALAEVGRCLRPGGMAFFHLPAYEWLRSAHDDWVHTRRRYRRADCVRMLSEGNLEGDVIYRNSFLFPIMAAHRLTLGRFRKQSDMQAISPWMNRLFFQVISLEVRLSLQGFNLPFGGSLWVRAVKPH